MQQHAVGRLKPHLDDALALVRVDQLAHLRLANLSPTDLVAKLVVDFGYPLCEHHSLRIPEEDLQLFGVMGVGTHKQQQRQQQQQQQQQTTDAQQCLFL